MELIRVKSMNKKAGVRAAAGVLVASLAFVGSAAPANAVPVALEVAADHVLVGGVTELTVSGCSVGASLSISDGSSEQVIAVGNDTMPVVIEIAHDDYAGGSQVTFTATCTPVDGSDEPVSSASEAVYFFGTWVSAVPPEFFAGEPVTISAGDFEPGVAVSLEVYPEGTDQLVFSAPLGTSGADFSVSGTVTFPGELECGTYDLDIIGGATTLPAQLYICGEAEESPSPSPSPTATASATASASPSGSPSPTTSPSASATATATATATASATRSRAPRPNPGLPDTGN